MRTYLKAFTVVALSFVLMGQTRFPAQGGGVGVGDNNTWTGTQTFDDEAFLVCDDGDGTKCLEFESSGITGSTTRTLTVPDASGTLPLLGVSQTWSGQNIFGTTTSGAVLIADSISIAFGNLQTHGGISNRTALTPDSPLIMTGTVSNSWLVGEVEDANFDFQNGPGGTSPTTAPHITWVSQNQDAAEYSSRAYYGTAGKWVTTLTESSATAVLTIPVADNTSVSGTIKAKTFASDGTDHQARYAELKYVAVNEADTETCTLSGADQTDDGNINAITSGTLTYAWTCTTGTNTVTINLNAVSSLTQTTLSFEGRVDHIGAGEPLPQ